MEGVEENEQVVEHEEDMMTEETKMITTTQEDETRIVRSLPDPVTILAPPDYLQQEDRPQKWPLPHVCETDRLKRWKDNVPKERNAFYMSRSFGASFATLAGGSFVLVHSGRSRQVHESTEDLDDDHVMLENLPSSVVTLEKVYPAKSQQLRLNFDLMRLARESR